MPILDDLKTYSGFIILGNFCKYEPMVFIKLRKFIWIFLSTKNLPHNNIVVWKVCQFESNLQGENEIFYIHVDSAYVIWRNGLKGLHT